MKKIIFLTLILLQVSATFSQVDTINTENKKSQNQHFIGANAGFTTGVGLSYIYNRDDYSVQLTALPLFDQENSKYSFGLTLSKYVVNTKKGSYYFYIGNHFTNFESTDPIYNIGAGPGVEGGDEFFKVRFSIGLAVMGITSNIMTRPTAEFGLYLVF
ncbi:hypothetical protein ACFLQ5_02985 [Bacteroidota bacterium]